MVMNIEVYDMLVTVYTMLMHVPLWKKVLIICAHCIYGLQQDINFSRDESQTRHHQG